MAAIWFWVASQFWNMRAAGWQFGVFISLFTLIWGFFAILWGSSLTAETIPMFLALCVYVYLNWPGVRQAFVKSEMDRLTPEQSAAIEQLEAANASAGTKTLGCSSLLKSSERLTPAGIPGRRSDSWLRARWASRPTACQP